MNLISPSTTFLSFVFVYHVTFDNSMVSASFVVNIFLSHACQFLSRDCMYAKCAICYHPSIHLSVTWVDQSKTVDHAIFII